jgi:hypothetical protein
VPKLVGLALRIWSKLCRTVSELLGLDDEPSESGGGLVAAERMSVSQSHSAATTPPG